MCDNINTWWCVEVYVKETPIVLLSCVLLQKTTFKNNEC